MKIKNIIIGAVVVLALLGAGGWGVSRYNSLVAVSEEVDNAWALVQNQYQRRLDLIPNLVETVKGYAAHENETYTNVARARAGLTEAYNNAAAESASAPMSEASLKEVASRQAELQRALSIYVNAVHEAYPQLKANEQFLDLQTQLEGTENRIATERGRYTDVVRKYNVMVRRFPTNIFAGMMGFEKRPQFEADAAAQKAPKVQF